ncbi:MAG: adenylate/guanylate cyclase domain-containing protein [Dehalococcoidia bacterium]|nr:adenylate/guanylate cyclase domain-containing protein [Dehalococcoidia bacterium]
MDGRIQYAVASDGVNVAFNVAGKGEPLVHLTPVGGAALKRDQFPSVLQYTYEKLSERRQLIRYDIRGTGLSDREIPPLSLDALMNDMLAVLDRSGVAQADFFAVSSAGPAAIAFAANHPERVRRLVLWCTSAYGSDIQSSARLAIDSLAGQDWRIYTETIASAMFGWDNAEDARRMAALIRETTSPEGRADFYGFVRETDVSHLLPKVQAPTLVIHFRSYPLVPASAATRLAAQLPEADMMLFEGNALFPQRDELQLVIETVDAFLGGPGRFDPPPRRWGPGESVAGLRTILFTDVEGSTALTQRLGDEQARSIMRQHERITRQALAEHGGAEVKALGDGFMASFESASRALECAVAIQQAFEAFNSLGNAPIRVRIGVNAGEPIAEGADLFGTAVNLTARIAAQADGGQVLVSDVVRQLVAGKGFLFSDQGDVLVRGFEDPVRLFELRWGNKAPTVTRAATDPLDAWRRNYFED